MNNSLSIKSVFWTLVCAMFMLFSWYIMKNATWLLGDDCQCLIYTGWDKPIFGFFVPPTLGRFFPLDYTIYDILCLFYDDQIPASAHYFVHVICFGIFILSFIAVSLFILTNQKTIWRYTITLFIVILIIGRTLGNFVHCWTGIWTIFTFIPVFVLGAIKFQSSHKWQYAILALVSINYVLYYYETMFIIPLVIGCSCLFMGNKVNDRYDRIFYWLLVASGFLFLLLYSILVLPNVGEFYNHHIECSKLTNAMKMLWAQKILCLVVVIIILRGVCLIKHRSSFCLYDSFLLAALGYYCGAAFLGLNFTLYYTPATLVSIPAILFFANEYLNNKWVGLLFLALAIFYGRKIPNDIIVNQSARISTYNGIQTIIKERNEQPIFFFAPDDPQLQMWDIEERDAKKYHLQTVLGWHIHREEFESIKKDFCSGEPGLWQVIVEDEPLFLSQCPQAEFFLELGGCRIYRVN